MGQSPPGATCSREPVGLPLLNGPTDFGSFCPTPTAWTSSPQRIARAGDLLLCVRGSTTGRMNRADQEYAIGRGVAAVRCEGSLDTNFVFFALAVTMDSLLSVASGSVFPNLASRDLAAHAIPWPDVGTRAGIAQLLGALDHKMQGNDALTAAVAQLATALVSSGTDDLVPLGELASPHRVLRRPQDFDGLVVQHFSLPAFDDGRLPQVRQGRHCRATSCCSRSRWCCCRD